MQRSLEVKPGCMPSAPPNSLLIKQKEAYWCYFSVLVFLLAFRRKNFADALANIAAFIVRSFSYESVCFLSIIPFSTGNGSTTTGRLLGPRWH